MWVVVDETSFTFFVKTTPTNYKMIPLLLSSFFLKPRIF